MRSIILPVIQIAPSMTSGKKMRSRNLHHPVSFSALSFSAAVYVADTPRAAGRPFSCSHRTVASFASVRTSPPHGSSIRFECVPVSSSTRSFIVRYPTRNGAGKFILPTAEQFCIARMVNKRKLHEHSDRICVAQNV